MPHRAPQVKRIKYEWTRLTREAKHDRDDRGFSLLEMVVAMGILIVLTVGGILAYNGINQNAKEAATLAAAKSVYTAANAYDLDNNAATDPMDAADEYNNSQDSVDGDGDTSTLVTQVNRLDDGSLCSVATYGDDEIVEVVGASSVDECIKWTGSPTLPEQEQVPDVDDDYSVYRATYNPSLSTHSCSGGKAVTILLKDNVDVLIDWGDGTPATRYQQDLPTHCYTSVSLKTVEVTGTFDSLSNQLTNTCYVSDPPHYNEPLISVDHWGEGTGTKSANCAFIGANNIVSVASPPSTLTQMSAMFANSKFNGDISNWNMSQVTAISNMFYGNKVFNGNIGNWDVTNVKNALRTFSNATSFDQDLSNWNLSNVERFDVTKFAEKSPLASQPDKLPKFN